MSTPGALSSLGRLPRTPQSSLSPMLTNCNSSQFRPQDRHAGLAHVSLEQAGGGVGVAVVVVVMVRGSALPGPASLLSNQSQVELKGLAPPNL